MGVRLHLFVDGVEQLDTTLVRFADNAQDARPAFDEMADSFENWMRRQFDSEGAYTTGRWAPLSPRYGRWKARHFPGRKILERTGAMKLGLTRQPFNIDVREPRYMILGTSDPNASRHQHGGSNAGGLAALHDVARTAIKYQKGYGKKSAERFFNANRGAMGLPARVIIKMPAVIRTQWRKILQKHLVGLEDR